MQLLPRGERVKVFTPVYSRKLYSSLSSCKLSLALQKKQIEVTLPKAAWDYNKSQVRKKSTAVLNNHTSMYNNENKEFLYLYIFFIFLYFYILSSGNCVSFLHQILNHFKLNSDIYVSYTCTRQLLIYFLVYSRESINCSFTTIAK